MAQFKTAEGDLREISGLQIADTGGLVTATTVEDAIAELATEAAAEVAESVNVADLALTTTPGGASLVGIYDAATLYTATTVEAALAEVRVLANAAIALAKKTVTVGQADLSGASQAVNIGTALPSNAIVLAHELNVVTKFIDQADLTITIGGTDADAIVASTDLDTLEIGKYQGTLGVHPRGTFSTEQLVATFAATDLTALSAGSITITVWYSILA
jgi:hypothetical protein